MDNHPAIKGNTQIEEVKEYESRIAQFLPGGKDIPTDIRMGMAQLAIAHGLDPWLREVWPIPSKDRQGNITGWALMVGITGWRSSAHRSNEFWGRRFEKCSDEERKWLRAGPNDIAIKCFVLRRKTGNQPMEFDGYGLYKDGEYTKMNPLFAARLRAERDAMKAAFPICAPVGIEVKYGDESGDEINGYHGPQWEDVEEGSNVITGEELQAQLSENKKKLGRDDGDLTAQTRPAQIVTDEQADKARAEFQDAETKFDAPETTTEADSGKAAFDAYCDTRNMPDFKRLAIAHTAGDDYRAALELAKKTK